MTCIGMAACSEFLKHPTHGKIVYLRYTRLRLINSGRMNKNRISRIAREFFYLPFQKVLMQVCSTSVGKYNFISCVKKDMRHGLTLFV